MSSNALPFSKELMLLIGDGNIFCEQAVSAQREEVAFAVFLDFLIRFPFTLFATLPHRWPGRLVSSLLPLYLLFSFDLSLSRHVMKNKFLNTSTLLQPCLRQPILHPSDETLCSLIYSLQKKSARAQNVSRQHFYRLSMIIICLNRKCATTNTLLSVSALVCQRAAIFIQCLKQILMDV